jgi:hypothetical protein
VLLANPRRQVFEKSGCQTYSVLPRPNLVRTLLEPCSKLDNLDHFRLEYVPETFEGSFGYEYHAQEPLWEAYLSPRSQLREGLGIS